MGLRAPALARRQLCWSHLQRDFTAHAEGLAAEKEFGEHGLELCERVFWAWEVFQHTDDRRELKRTITQLQREYKPIIRRLRLKNGAQQALPRHGTQPAQGLARAVDLRHTQRRAADQQPRRARPARRRHLPQALASAANPSSGERRIERLLSAHTTCRLQRRSLFAYLTEALTAHARGDPVPTARLSSHRLNAYTFAPLKNNNGSTGAAWVFTGGL